MSFDGDCLMYHAFLNSFDCTIHHSTVADADKHNCLLEYCTGKAARVIQPCALMSSPTQGYLKARELLKKRFGDPHAIAKAWIAKIVDGQPVKPNNGESLREFADDVTSCLEPLRAMNKLNEIDSQDRMVKVVSRLPVYLQSRWRKKAFESKDSKDRYPTFEELSRFLDRVADEACDPVFGKIDVQRPKKGMKLRPTGRAPAISTFELKKARPIMPVLRSSQLNLR
ncbi:uncharacterized protein LOC135491065 [Lineus longissimus]|uniref:uncharacterized protein LOC135491065 n=1 Tax=Lineus longissimus TaxID=88925 RepID=UPI00315DE765